MKKRSKDRGSGLIIGFLNSASDKIMKALTGGFFGKIFTSYEKLERKARKGVIFGAFSRRAGGREKSIRRKTLEHFDKSLIVGLLRRIVEFLRSSRLSFYGAYFVSFGIYSLVVLLTSSITQNGGAPAPEIFAGQHFWSALVITLASLPLLFSNRSLVSLAGESVTLRALLEEGAGITEEKFEETKTVRNRHSYFFAVILGILTAGATYFASPLKILVVIAFICIFCLILMFPEMGVVSTIFIAPFLGVLSRPSLVLGIFVAITVLSYLIKVMVGKRTVAFRFLDIFVLLFAILMFFGGVVTSGGAASFKSAVIYTLLMMMYFLVVNLMNTKAWLERCVFAIAIPSGIIAALGIVSYTATTMPSKWIDAQMFADIGNRAVSTFGNPNMLATYLVLTAPFIWSYLKKRNISSSGRVIAIIGSVVSAACTVLTWSRGGWLGLIAAAIVYALVNYRYTLKYFLIGAVSSPVWIGLLPSNITSRFASIGNLADSSTYYRLFTWKGSLRMLADHFASGIGVGQSAFSQIYPLYAYVGNEITAHSHNLYLEIAVELGIMGLLVFLAVIFMTAQRGFGCIKYNSADRTAISGVSAAMAGVFGVLVHGMFDYVWYNYRVFFMIWVMIGVLCAFANVYPKKSYDNTVHYDMDKEASLDIIFGQKNDAIN